MRRIMFSRKCLRGIMKAILITLSLLFIIIFQASYSIALTPVNENPEKGYEDRMGGERVVLQPMVYKEAKEVGFGESRFKIIPTASVTARADDNFYRTADNERDVFEILFQPGLQLEYDTGRTRFSLGYTLNAHAYEDIDDPPAGRKDANDDNFIGHSFSFIGRTIPTAKITLGLEDIFYLTNEPSKADRISNDTRRQEYYINRLTPMLYYQMTERFSLDLRYRNTITAYDDETDEDSMEHAGIVGLNYEFRPTWWMALGYEYTDRDYDIDISDYTQDHIRLSLRKQSKYNLYEASVGYSDRQFDERKDEDTFTYLLAFTRQLGYDTYARIALERDFNQSGIAENFFVADQASLRFGKTFREKIPATLRFFYREGRYQQDSYLLPTERIEDREDDRYGVQASIGYYLFRWMTLVLSGGYENNESNIDEFEYDNTYITLGVNTAFNIGNRN